MKIAITSMGQSLDDSVDPRFGRAKYLLIVDTATMEFEVIDNSANINAFKGAGIQTATMISDRGAEVLLTGYCGPNAFRTAQAAGIKVVNDVSGTVKSVLQQFMQGSLQYSAAPNAEGHW
jgi:predicted Fe-Mo cluster-binding NifX family protein